MSQFPREPHDHAEYDYVNTVGHFKCDCCGLKETEGQVDANTKMNVCEDCKPEYIASLVEEGDKTPDWQEIELDYD